MDLGNSSTQVARSYRIVEGDKYICICNEAGDADRGSELGECMCMDEFEVLDLHDTEIPFAFDDDVALVDMPEDTPYVQGAPDNMHVHVVQMNSLDDEFDGGFV